MITKTCCYKSEFPFQLLLHFFYQRPVDLSEACFTRHAHSKWFTIYSLSIYVFEIGENVICFLNLVWYKKY